jgi:hypothetical protein
MIALGHIHGPGRLNDKVCHECGEELYVGRLLEAVLCEG